VAVIKKGNDYKRGQCVENNNKKNLEEIGWGGMDWSYMAQERN
jgi:hypothetical protein